MAMREVAALDVITRVPVLKLDGVEVASVVPAFVAIQK
jgi:hypothetical protein